MKISVIGAGNVGSLTAMRLAEAGLGQILLIDIIKGLAQGKALDLEDARSLLKNNYDIQGSDDIGKIENSDIVIVTAGLARKPGMTREELLLKNSQVLKGVCLKIKALARQAIVVMVTNPLDIMTYYALKVTGFKSSKVFGMGISLDTSRFVNLIAQELKVPVTDVEAMVIGSHGQGMLPLAGLSKIKGTALGEFINNDKVKFLTERTIDRGAEIVANLGTGSAFFAPAAAILEIARSIVLDEKRVIGVCAYLNGEYGIRDSCIGVPCRLGKKGIEAVLELNLSAELKTRLAASASAVRQAAQQLTL